MKIAFVTGARSDWPLVEPLLRAASRQADLVPQVVVTGSHLSARHGHTVDLIRSAGWEPAACVTILEEDDTPLRVARATGRAVADLADALVGLESDWLMVTGDRYESFAAAVAATMLGVPLAHVAGGETDVATNQDCNLRNALTKLAQVHLVAHELARRRVLALGEEPWRIHLTGLPSLDGIAERCADRDALTRAELIPAQGVFVLVSYLPVTLRPGESLAHLDALLVSLAQLPDVHKLVVLSNADAGAAEHDQRVRTWASERRDVTVVPTLESALYLAALRDCACYVGNSSSSVIESPAFGTPAVIVGSRQDGRPRAENVRAVPAPTVACLTATIRAQVTHGRYSGVRSPFGDGHASERICAALRESRQRADLMSKRLVVPESAP